MRTRPSYVNGIGTQPLSYQTVGQTLDIAADRWSEHTALVVRHQDVRWTYRELQERTESLAVSLIGLGLQPGDRIGIWSPNNAEWVLTQFATAKAGLILVNINPAYRLAELRHALGAVGCKALVFARRFKSSDYVAMLRELVPELTTASPGALVASAVPELRHLICLDLERVPGCHRFGDLAAAIDPSTACVRKPQPEDAINIQFTSGTTGTPKGATLSHHNIVNNAWFVGERMRLAAHDRLCIPVPLYHCFGMVIGVLTCVSHGATIVLPGESFDPLSVLEAVEAERCTALHGVPTMFIALLDHPEFARFDLSSLRTGIMAGAPCPREVMRRVMDSMHMREITIAYGMTETSPATLQSDVDDSAELRVATVGRALPHIEVKIVDHDGSAVAVGTPGELLTRGYCVMQGYWNDKERTDGAIDEHGWMHTGDLATLDERGYCRIVGRVKDLIIRGGENIYPREIEELLYLHPAVAEAAVFGVADPKYGEEVCAWVLLRPGNACTEEELRQYCRERISYFKVPRYVQFVSAFPMTVTGKIQKFEMRKTMAEKLGANRPLRTPVI